MKNTMTRILSLTLALLTILSTLALVSCGGGSSDGYVFKVGSVTLLAGGSADVVANLGTPISCEESASCGGIPGTDKLYVFNGYRVKTTPGHDGDVIAMIELTNDSLKTPEGLTIGSTRDQVTKALGTGEAMGENLVYKKGNMKLQILFRGDAVINIQYVKA